MVWWRNRAALSFEFVFFWLGFYFVFHLFTFIKNSKLFNIYNFIIIIIFYKNNQAKLPFLPSFLKQEIITQHEKISRLYINKKNLYQWKWKFVCVIKVVVFCCCCCSKLPITRKSNYSYLKLCVFFWLNCMFLFLGGGVFFIISFIHKYT